MKTDKLITHLNFYKNHKISPVRQNLKEKSKLFERRDSLYSHLGINKSVIKNSEILEVGPAEGHNSAYLSSCNPKLLHLVEPNPNAYKNIKKTFKKLGASTKKLKVFPVKLENFKKNKKYDLVICEAWLGNSYQERKLMKKLSNFVKKGGQLVTTLSCPLGWVYNVVRRFTAFNIIKDEINFNLKTKKILHLYKPHLKTLKNMSCPYIDWVQDSMLNPGFLNTHPDPSTFFKDIGNRFNFSFSYPAFYSNWNWYKSLIGKKKDRKKFFQDSYIKNICNFLDYNNVYIEKKLKITKKLNKTASDLINNLIEYEESPSTKNYNFFLKSLSRIIFLLNVCKIKTTALTEVQKILKHKKFKKIKKLKNFKKKFGKELLYISVERVK
jgi:hypothetical protein